MPYPQQKRPKPSDPIDPLVMRVADYIDRHRLFEKGDLIIVAVSGGSDSLALLHLLAALPIKPQLIAAYIDHQLRPEESPEEQRLIAQYCGELAIPFVTVTVDVPQLIAEKNRSPEEAARLLRYQALEDLRHHHQASLIAVGHTADDQIEEFFLRLFRGSGCKGFSGMRPRRGKVIRPLLEESKAALMEYLERQQLSWCIDSSNNERQYLRNRIRLELLPYLERDFSAGLRGIVKRTMELLGAEEELLEVLAQKAFDECCHTGLGDAVAPKALTLELAASRRQHPALLRRVIEICFWKLGARPSFIQIDIVRDFLEGGATGGILHLQGGLRAELRKDEMRLFRLPMPAKGRAAARTPKLEVMTIPGPGRYLLPGIGRELRLEKMAATEQRLSSGLSIDADHLTFPLELRAPRPGERFLPCHGSGSKKVSRFLSERRIPASERFAWPVLAKDERILALPGLEITDDCRVTERTRNILAIDWLVWSSQEEPTEETGNER